MKRCALLAILFWQMSGSFVAGAEPIRQFAGGESPVKQDWIEDTKQPENVSGKIAGKAWRIEDDDDSGPEWRSYHVELTPDELTPDERDRARREGFTYRWRLRIPVETLVPTRAIGVEVAAQSSDGSRLRLAIQMGRRGDELLAKFHTGPGGSVEGGVRVKDVDAFHDWELLFD